MTERGHWAIPHDMDLEHFKLKRKIFSGSKTTAYLAEDASGKRIAVTLLEKDRILEQYKLRAVQDGKSMDEAEKEAGNLFERYQCECREAFKRVAGLSHPRVAKMYGINKVWEEDRLIIFSEYVPGIDFFYATRGLDPLQMIFLFYQSLEGLQFIHNSGLLHLNIKPARIRVDLEFEPPSVKFIDFGFAIPIEGYEGEYIGTPTYMAPEVILGQRERINKRADLYSFAVMAYLCLTGRHPFEHRSGVADRQKLKAIVEKETLVSPPSHSNKKVPTELDNLILGLLQRNPEERPFGAAADVLAFCDEKWARESKEIPHETTTTLDPRIK